MNYQAMEPDNYQQKCLCVLLLDVSGSMIKEDRIGKLNAAITQFYDDIIHGKNGVAKTTVQQLEVEIITFDQEPKIIRQPKLLSRNEIPPVLQTRGSTTETVKAIEFAMEEVVKRKRRYDQTGQCYYRPWIVLMTDDNPTSPQSEIDRIAPKLLKEVKEKHFSMIGVCIADGVTRQTLSKLCAGHETSLSNLRFGNFFRWLSRSLSTITKSNDDESVDISVDADSWMKDYKI